MMLLSDFHKFDINYLYFDILYIFFYFNEKRLILWTILQGVEVLFHQTYFSAFYIDNDIELKVFFQTL